MALKMTFTIGGKVYPDAYWRIGDCHYKDRDDALKIFMDMYEDADARENDKKNGKKFTKSFSMPVGDISAFEQMKIIEMKAALYNFVKDYKDGTPPPVDENGVPLYPDNRPHFFATAQDV